MKTKSKEKKAIVILDFGSQYTHLIKAQLYSLSINSVIEAADCTVSLFQRLHSNIGVAGIILSGGPQSIYTSKIKFDRRWLQQGIPILGICFGHQLLAHLFGGVVQRGQAEYGREFITIKSTSKLLKGLPKRLTVWMSHRDTVTKLPRNFVSRATSSYGGNTIIEQPNLKFYGLQFHPEVSHTQGGLKILSNFVTNICLMPRFRKWTPQAFIAEAASIYRDKVWRGKVLCAVSGGVDSMTLLALLRKTLSKPQLLAVYIDSGLMPVATKAEVRAFCHQYDITLLVHDASNIFFRRLKGITDPSLKCKVIGKIFIEEFEKIATQRKIHFLAQGTIWSDVVESGITKFSSQIKPHHNVAGLPSKLHVTLIEPLRELFKDQVRIVAKKLKLPNPIVNKKVFPGPGFAIRVEGEVTRKKVTLVRQTTEIIESIIFESKIARHIWMAFAILINVPSLGVKGDGRIENKHAMVVRIVESKNSMTANFSRRALPYLEAISDRIIKETPIGRVVYDITNKPPATIEWQ